MSRSRRHLPPFLWLLLLVAQLLVVQLLVAHIPVAQAELPQRVLFVGNSYLYYNDSLHNHVERIVAELQPDLALEFKSATIGGAPLAHHSLHHLLEPKRLGVQQPFDVVILQGASFAVLSAQNQLDFFAQVEMKNKQIQRSGATTALYMTHAYVPPHPQSDATMTAKVAQMYIQAGKKIDAPVIPVGLAFARAYAEKPQLSLHKAFDGTHPNLAGTYLAACVVVATLWQLTPVGVEYNYFAALDAATTQFLQQVAWQTVREFQQ